MIFKILLIIHLIVDFWFQNDDSIEKKEKQSIFVNGFYKTELFKHVLIYVSLSCMIFTLYRSTNLLDYLIVVSLFMSHAIIDLIKLLLSKKIFRLKTYFFFTDQLLHILVLIVISLFIKNNFTSMIEIGIYENVINYLLAIVLLGKIGNVIFSALFSKYKPIEDVNDMGHKNAGAVIGIMERLLMLIFLVVGDFTAIGYVIAAKSLARFSKLSKAQFGEYFIIGTLFSVLYTILVYFIILS